jgi:hypothetical protein
MMSKAFTKEVQNKGRIRVKYSNLASMAQISPAVDARKTIHHTAVFFLVFSMSKNFGKNKG